MIEYQKIKKLDKQGLITLSADVRKKIIEVTAKNGGHLASNLGAVELTVALHYVFNFPTDKLIFDVGHQCYAHKLLTQGEKAFETIRAYHGIGGFLKANETPFDAVDTGHSSEAMSLATGFLRARKLSNKSYEVVAVVGDGAFAGGMCFEALHDLATKPEKLILILNDNEVTISETVSGINNILKHGKTFFNEFGFEYIGEVDGHDVSELVDAFEKAKKCDKSVVVHLKTVKGKGVAEAELDPETYHSYPSKAQAVDYSAVVGDTLLELAAKDDKIVAITAAMKAGTGLSKYADAFPDRFFDVGICEEHAMAMTVGLAKEGFKPYFAVYSSFLNRCFDQLVNDVALQKLPVTILLDRGGFIGGDGETHQGIINLNYLNTIPNLTIVAPKNMAETEAAIRWSEGLDSPLVIRYPKGSISVNEPVEEISYSKYDNIDISASDAIILTTGANMYSFGKKLADSIIEKGVKATTVNAKFIKPLDEQFLICASDKPIIVLEDSVEFGGLCQSILGFYNKRNLNARVLGFCPPTAFLPCGSFDELLMDFGFNLDEVTDKCVKFLNNK